MTRYKHLGASGTEAHIEALMQINRRNQLEAKIENPGFSNAVLV
ncbi:MAG: hypothetical protein QNJ65_20610 [Xenococcaceae cyanobacterium MO_234.B1]|nr:hypothetical protein [Xenococcaceae cyanobacterium MO_234.B1]